MAKDTPKVGRPSKMTDEAVKKLEEVFAIDGTIEEACYYADISRQTYYDWIKENPELVDKFERLRERPVLKARTTVVNSLGNPEHAFRYLSKKKRNEFADRIEQDITTGGEKITSFTEEEKNKLLSLLNDSRSTD